MKRFEIVPNFSEGRRQDVIDALCRCYQDQTDAMLLDYEFDADHNRCVLTAVGTAEALIEATLAACRIALREIDLNHHKGGHPRMGALDVLPFLPLEDATMEDAIAAARALGHRLWDELRIPVYFYEEASLGQKRLLPEIRKGNFEGLREAVKMDASRRPDVGGPDLHETFGATVIGARKPLVAFNVYLRSLDMDIAKAIAKAVRESSGGLRNVRAIAIDTTAQGSVQVSMNLVDVDQTPIYRAYEFVVAEAAHYGVSVSHAEVVGLVPLSGMLAVAERSLRLKGFHAEQVLEVRLAREGRA
ncbi:MAG: glutamate formimidoyltransferase [Thermaerobacter sp.]|nr:glutamate formimidoyltransferase [Thermaerobacter sp.]